MSPVTRTITLTSDQHFGRRLPPQALGHVLTAITTVVRRSISMAFRGRSSLSGSRPHWLKAAADIRFLDHQGDDESVLVFEVPTLGEAAADLYRQQEFWSTRPDPSATGLDLLGDVLRDVAARNEDSDRFDKRLLSRLVGFRNILNGTFRELRLDPTDHDPKPPAVINPEVIKTAQEFEATTPPRRPVCVFGNLISTNALTNGFILRLLDGQPINGVLLFGSFAENFSSIENRMLVVGEAIYRRSGQLLRIDAYEILRVEGEYAIWSRIPPAKKRQFDLKEILRQQSHKKGVSAILGQWLGDETDEEIERVIRDMS